MPHPVSEWLSADDEALEQSWSVLQTELAHRFGGSVGVEGMLFLIGIQEEGRGFEPRLKKERKQELIMRGTHSVMETLGLYRRVGGPDTDDVSWERTHPLPELTIEEQEKLLRVGIIRYFAAHLR